MTGLLRDTYTFYFIIKSGAQREKNAGDTGLGCSALTDLPAPDLSANAGRPLPPRSGEPSGLVTLPVLRAELPLSDPQRPAIAARSAALPTSLKLPIGHCDRARRSVDDPGLGLRADRTPKEVSRNLPPQ
eukprot:761539-Hanusia_phi.AAC.4